MSSAGQDVFGVDDLLDFSGHRDDVLSSSTTDILHNTTTTSSTASGSQFLYSFNINNTTDFTDHFSLPSDDVAELEWLSKFVDDSFSNFPANNITGTVNYRPENTSSFNSRSRSRNCRGPVNNTSWTSSSTPVPYTSSTSASNDTTSENGRRCTHCSSEKTPQWRTGPFGPKTLCNACGVRYKSGRLVPEYRPAASPTFVLNQHSNSHRKVMELRRQKEMMLGHQVVSSEHQIYGGGNHYHHRQQRQLHHGSNYEIC